MRIHITQINLMMNVVVKINSELRLDKNAQGYRLFWEKDGGKGNIEISPRLKSNNMRWWLEGFLAVLRSGIIK